MFHVEQYEHKPPSYPGKGGKEPRKLNARDIDELKTMSGLGMPLRQMAAILKMHEETLKQLIKKDAAAQAALEEGRAIASHNVRKSAYEMAKTDPSMMRFWLKTREGFREVERIELTGKDGEAIKILSTEDRKKQFAKMRRAIEITEKEAKKNGQDTE